jgi:hypothetical protein
VNTIIVCRWLVEGLLGTSLQQGAPAGGETFPEYLFQAAGLEAIATG